MTNEPNQVMHAAEADDGVLHTDAHGGAAKRYLPILIVAIVGIATVASGIMLYRANRPAVVFVPGGAGSTGEIEKGVHVRGPATAPVTLEEFGDFQCPPCGMLAGPLRDIEKEDGSNLRVIFRNFPLPMHQHAMQAAIAAEAAGLQGKFWEMHDLLYREQPIWSKAADVRMLFVSYAGVLGLDLVRFNKDLDNPEVKARVERDQNLGAKLGVRTTPTLFINNQSVPPTSLNPEALRKAIKQAIESKIKPS
jgi:protein-disulfide isomerase